MGARRLRDPAGTGGACDPRSSCVHRVRGAGDLSARLVRRLLRMACARRKVYAGAPDRRGRAVLDDLRRTNVLGGLHEGNAGDLPQMAAGVRLACADGRSGEFFLRTLLLRRTETFRFRLLLRRAALLRSPETQ